MGGRNKRRLVLGKVGMNPYLTYLTYRTYLTFKGTLMTQTSKPPTISTNDIPSLRRHRLGIALGYVSFDSAATRESAERTGASTASISFESSPFHQLCRIADPLRHLDLRAAALLG